MDPSMMQDLFSDPEIMSLMQRPDVMQRLMAIQQDPSPERMMEIAQDPELSQLFARLSSRMGGGGMGGMGDMGGYGGYGGAGSTSSYTNTSTASTYTIREITSLSQFESIIKHAEVPVVVDFHAVWCGPCKMIAPKYASLANEYNSDSSRCKIVFLKVDGDKAREIVDMYDITGFPTFIFFDEGSEYDRFSGADVNRLTETLEMLTNSYIRRTSTPKAPTLTFTHFPVRTNERVFYPRLQIDKLLPNLLKIDMPSSASDKKASIEMLGAAITEPGFMNSPLSASLVSILKDMLSNWTPETYSSVLHVYRVLALHPEGSKLLLKDTLSPVPSTPTLQYMLNTLSDTDNTVVATIALRFFANCFSQPELEKYIVTTSIGEELCEFIMTVGLSFSSEKHILIACFGICINMAYALVTFKDKDVPPSCVQLINSVYTTCLDLVTLVAEMNPDEAVVNQCKYTCIVIVGTLLTGLIAQKTNPVYKPCIDHITSEAGKINSLGEATDNIKQGVVECIKAYNAMKQ